MSSQIMQMAWQFNWESQPIAHAQQQRQTPDHCSACTEDMLALLSWSLIELSHTWTAHWLWSIKAHLCCSLFACRSTVLLQFSSSPDHQSLKWLLMVPIKHLIPLLNPTHPINHWFPQRPQTPSIRHQRTAEPYFLFKYPKQLVFYLSFKINPSKACLLC